jgi:hypothetical protein
MVAFANQHFGKELLLFPDKRKGRIRERHKGRINRKITPVVTNRDTSSDFLKHISSISKQSALTPKFHSISTKTLSMINWPMD